MSFEMTKIPQFSFDHSRILCQLEWAGFELSLCTWLHTCQITIQMPHHTDYIPGQHDVTAWQETRIPQEHAHLLDEDEFIWGDSAYPLKSWCQGPYKKYNHCY